jgi:hypothetical protein
MRKLLSTTAAALAVTVALGSALPAYAYPPPPALRYEVRPPLPHPGYVWRPGYWNWYGGRYVWVGGVYIAPGGPGYIGYGPGAHWVPGHWGPRGRWIPAHWA